MKVTLKNLKVQELVYGIDNISKIFSEKLSTKLVFSLNRNKVKLEEVSKALDEAKKPYLEYEKLRMDLIKKFAAKDENGEIVFTNEEKTSVKISDAKKFDEESKELFEQFSDKIKEFEDLLKEEVEVEIVPISISQFPEKCEDDQLFKVLFPLIEENY